MCINIDKNTKIAIHSFEKKRSTFRTFYNSLYIGPNPLGPKGGKGGNVVDAVQIAQYTTQSAWGEKFKHLIMCFLQVNIAAGCPIGNLTDDMLKRYEKISKKRSLSIKKCVFEMLKDFKKEDLPLAIDNDYVKQFLLQKE